MKELKDIEWCLLDLLMRAKQKGVSQINRKEILYSPSLPVEIRLRLGFHMLLMDTEIINALPDDNFSITEKGEAMYNFRYGTKSNPKPEPSKVADNVIYLPDFNKRADA